RCPFVKAAGPPWKASSPCSRTNTASRATTCRCTKVPSVALNVCEADRTRFAALEAELLGLVRLAARDLLDEDAVLRCQRIALETDRLSTTPKGSVNDLLSCSLSPYRSESAIRNGHPNSETGSGDRNRSTESEPRAGTSQPDFEWGSVTRGGGRMRHCRR